jgi:hypothetical protein
MKLVDCGQASEVTHGQMNALWYEQGPVPFNKNVCYIPPNGQGIPQCLEGGVESYPIDLDTFKAGVEYDQQ